MQLALSDEGGVVIDNEMRSNLPDVYAAGDVCTANWAHSQLWFQVLNNAMLPTYIWLRTAVCVCVQMRLWTQGRQMGVYAARAMVAHSSQFITHVYPRIYTYTMYNVCVYRERGC